MLVDNEFGLLTPDGKKLTVEQLAEKIGIAKSTLYEWKKNPDFIRYKDYLADDQFATQRERVYRSVLDAIDRGSIKAMDLWMRRFGLLVDRQIVENETDPTKIPDLDELKRMVAEMDGEE
jgi:transcriptional regulator with XRE-family HTH domain